MNTEIFDMNKMYRFNKELTNGGKWTELCNGLIVEVESENLGKIKVNGEEYIIFPKWCDEIEVQCTSTEKGNVYKENIKNLIENIIIEEFYNMKESSSMKIKNLPQTLEGFFGQDSHFSKFKKGYVYIFDVMNVPNEELEPYMFKIDSTKHLTIVNENKAIIQDDDGIVHEIKRDWATGIEIFQKGVKYEFVYDFVDIEDRLSIKNKNLELYDGKIVKPISLFQAELECDGEIIKVKRSWCIECDEPEGI